MAEDMQTSVKDDYQLQALQAFMALAGLPTRVRYQFNRTLYGGEGER